MGEGGHVAGISVALFLRGKDYNQPNNPPPLTVHLLLPRLISTLCNARRGVLYTLI